MRVLAHQQNDHESLRQQPLLAKPNEYAPLPLATFKIAIGRSPTAHREAETAKAHEG